MAPSNPFTPATLLDPFGDPPDLPSLNAGPTQRLFGLLDDIRRSHRSTSALLLGPAGSGKTHVLSRLCRHAREIGALPIYVSLSPPQEEDLEQVYRGILRSLAQRALAGDGSLLHLIRGVCRRSGDSPEQVLDDLAGEIGLDRGLAAVLLRYPSLDPRRQQLLLRWLGGEKLMPQKLAELGARAPLDTETLARSVLKVLAVLSLSGLPLVLAIDHMETWANCGLDGLSTLSYLLADLRNALPNTLLVTLCPGEVWRNRLLGRLQRAHRDRLAEHCYELQPLSGTAARALIEMRMGPRDTAQEMLGEGDLLEVLRREPTPRAVLAACHGRYEERRSALVVDQGWHDLIHPGKGTNGVNGTNGTNGVKTLLIEMEALPEDPVLEEPLVPRKGRSVPVRQPRQALDDFEEPSIVLDITVMEGPAPLSEMPDLPTGPMRSQPILPLAMAPASPPPLSPGWQEEKLKMSGISREKE